MIPIQVHDQSQIDCMGIIIGRILIVERFLARMEQEYRSSLSFYRDEFTLQGAHKETLHKTERWHRSKDEAIRCLRSSPSAVEGPSTILQSSHWLARRKGEFYYESIDHAAARLASRRNPLRCSRWDLRARACLRKQT